MSSAIAIAGHTWQGNFHLDLLKIALYAAPFFVGGLVLGLVLSKRINPQGFKQLVLMLLGVMSLKLMW